MALMYSFPHIRCEASQSEGILQSFRISTIICFYAVLPEVHESHFTV